MIKYIKSVLWRVAKFLSYIEEARCLKVKLWIQRKGFAAKLFTDALERTPIRDLRIRKDWAAHTKNVFVLFAAKEALSLYIEAHLTKDQCIKIRIQAKMKNCDIYPSYHVIKADKE